MPAQLIIDVEPVSEHAHGCLACFCRDEATSKARLAREPPRVEDREGGGNAVKCGKMPFPGAGRFQCGIVLAQDKNMLK